MKITVILQKDALNIPVKLNTEEKNLNIYHRGAKCLEFCIPCGANGTSCDYVASINLNALGQEWNKVTASDATKEITIEGDFSKDFFDALVACQDKSVERLGMRPAMHFTPDYGWINDPNGLIYDGEYYHLYFQHNPFNTIWNNMSWGHAVSRDLLNWEQKDTVMYPDENGLIFSGSGLIHKGKFVFPYTVWGDGANWSKGKPTYQAMAVSSDKGISLEKLPGAFIGPIHRETRDPKVFWHEETRAYICVLNINENEFAIFRSSDLEKWEKTQSLVLEGAWECPDLVRVPVVETEELDGMPDISPKISGHRWMFWSAGGTYYWGSFDGYTFTPCGEKQEAFIRKHLYATQTFYGVSDRVVAISWIRTEKPMGDTYQGAMALPREYYAIADEGQYRLLQLPVREFIKAMQEEGDKKAGKDTCYLVNLKPEGDRAEATINGSRVIIDYTKKEISVDEEVLSFESPYTKKAKPDIQLIADHNILEFSIDNGIIGAALLKGENKDFSLIWRNNGDN